MGSTTFLGGGTFVNGTNCFFTESVILWILCSWFWDAECFIFYAALVANIGAVVSFLVFTFLENHEDYSFLHFVPENLVTVTSSDSSSDGRLNFVPIQTLQYQH